MYSNNYKLLAEALENALAPIAKLYSADTFKDSFDALTSKMKELYAIMEPIYSSEHFKQLALQLSVLCKSTLLILENSEIPEDSLSFLDNIDIQNEYVELTEDDCKSINTLLESSDASNDTPPKVSKGKMSMAEFIKSVLIPIFAIVLPILLTIYYHKVDSIESQKRYLEELQLKEKELKQEEDELRFKEQQLQNDIEQKEILKNILIEFQSLPEYIESLQVVPEYPPEAATPSDESPEPLDEDPRSSGSTQDNDLLSSDASKSSESAMHKEQK